MFKLRRFHLLAIVIIVGILLRIINISPFMLYPDSYQGLLIANNIIKYSNVLGQLGENGMLYPYVSFWTRPGYPVLIIFANLFFNDLNFSAKVVATVSGILIIPTIYLLTIFIFKNTKAALGAALFASISFNIVAWGGFGLSDNTGILCTIIFLILLFKNRQKQVEFGNLGDILTGLTFGFAILTRYEYAVLLLPLIFFIFLEERKPFVKLANILLSSIILINIVAVLLFPINDLIYGLVTQAKNTSTIVLIVTALIIFSGVINKNIRDKIKILSLNPIILLTYCFMLCLLAFQYSGIRNFLLYDSLIVFCVIVGFYFIYKVFEYSNIIVFMLMSILVLSATYFKINPDMQRYWMHLFPFILPIAGLGFSKLLESKKIIYFFSLGIFIQAIITFQGIKSWQNGAWFSKSYEEISSEILSKVVQPDDLLLSALPEGYYYFTKNPVQTLSNEYPYVYISDSLNDRDLVIVRDLAMDFYFPQFSNFLEENLSDFVFYQYKVNKNLMLVRDSHNENRPVNVYKINLGELKRRVLNDNINFAALSE